MCAKINLFPVRSGTRCESSVQSWPRKYTDVSFHIFQRQNPKHSFWPVCVCVANILLKNAVCLPVALLPLNGLQKLRCRTHIFLVFSVQCFIKVCNNINSYSGSILPISGHFSAVNLTNWAVMYSVWRLSSGYVHSFVLQNYLLCGEQWLFPALLTISHLEHTGDGSAAKCTKVLPASFWCPC